MAEGSGIDGLSLGMIGVGGLLAYAGIRGKSVPGALTALIQGKAPSAAPTANPIQQAGGGASSSGFLGIGSGAEIAADALRYQGAGYVWGGAPAQGAGNWDCSSFTNWVVGHDEGLAIPFYKAGGYDGSSHGPPTAVWLAWTGCDTVGHAGAAALPGDLAVWQTHMGICIGGGQMISAQNPASGTQVSGIDGFIPEILFIRRLKAVEQSTATIATAGPH